MEPLPKLPPPIKRPTGLKLLRIWRQRFREGLLTVLLVVQIFILFIMPAVRASGVPIPQIAITIVLLTFVSLAIALSRSRIAIVTLVVSVILTIIGLIWSSTEPNLLTDSVAALGQVLSQLSLLGAVASAVFGPGRITYHRILGAIVMYLGIGMIFTSLDMLLVRTIPNAFTHLPTNPIELREALTYFGFGTLTTGSFGDIAPLHPIARSLSNLESICGQLFPATLLARIVSLHGTSK